MISPITSVGTPSEPQKLREIAEKLEASFLAEMLKYSGCGSQKSEMSDGVGAGQFDSFLLEAQATKLVEAGGIGLSESIFQSLLERADVQNA